jgi:hypothetical protein
LPKQQRFFIFGVSLLFTMAYNRKNKLQTILKVQQCYRQHKQEGVTFMHVYRKYIYPEFLISRATAYTYLATPAVQELKKITAAAAQQQQLFL